MEAAAQYGGKASDITSANPHIAIMTNARVLAVSDNSTANKQVKRDATSAVWSAKQAMDGDSGSAGTYVSTATVRQHAAV